MEVLKNIKKLYEACKFYYGMNPPQAKEYLQTIDAETKKQLIKGYEMQCKKTFYND